MSEREKFENLAIGDRFYFNTWIWTKAEPNNMGENAWRQDTAEQETIWRRISDETMVQTAGIPTSFKRAG